MTTLSDLEFGLMLAWVGETWLVGRIAAPCPLDRLATHWAALNRVVSAAEIEDAISQLVRRQTLLALPTNGRREKGESEIPVYAVNRDWNGPPERCCVAATEWIP